MGEVMRAAEIGPSWRLWIAQQKTRRVPDTKIAEVLETNGVPHQLATREVSRASEDPYMQAALQIRRRDAKAVALLNVLGQVRKVDSGGTALDVRSRVAPSEFRDRYYATT